MLASEDVLIRSRDAGISLFLRNKRPKEATHFGPERTLLYVHGSTYPAESTFDLSLAELSWMDFIASHDWDVFLVDLRDTGARAAPPTLVVHAEWDADLPTYMAQGVFEKLTNVPYKRFVEIGEGTHSVLLEKNRMQLFREVQLFLDDPSPYSLTRLKGESKVLAD